jgi:[protein-PII] uridylyltransferase
MTSTKRTSSAARRGPKRKPRASRREQLANWLEDHPPAGVGTEEVEAHVRCMPARYWERVREEDLAWHLSAIHGFLGKLTRRDSAGSPIAVELMNPPRSKISRVAFCSWDRIGLLEQIVAAFNALRINILRADVYTRTDNLVLDVFEVCEPKAGAGRDGNRLKELSFLVEGAFSNPPRFASVWAAEFHKTLPRPDELDVEVRFDNRQSPDHTILHVEATDRLGLLYDLVHALTANKLEIAQAIIDTSAGVAKDQFHLADAEGDKITDAAQLRRLRKAVAEAITS